MIEEEICSICKCPRTQCLAHCNLRPGCGHGGVYIGHSPVMRGTNYAVEQADARAAAKAEQR